MMGFDFLLVQPRKKHETPPQNCSAAGFAYVLKQPKILISSGFRA